MKIGDKVKVADEEGIFIIKVINGNKAIVTDTYGFESIYQVNQLIPYVKYDAVYSNISNVTVKKEDNIVKKKNSSAKKEDKIREIDLHIGNIVDTIKVLEPHQMLTRQLIKAKEEIDKAKQDNVKKLILIHGKGKGILKSEIYKLLNTIDSIEFFEADIVKYRFGAVEIRFK